MLSRVYVLTSRARMSPAGLLFFKPLYFQEDTNRLSSHKCRLMIAQQRLRTERAEGIALICTASIKAIAHCNFDQVALPDNLQILMDSKRLEADIATFARKEHRTLLKPWFKIFWRRIIDRAHLHSPCTSSAPHVNI